MVSVAFSAGHHFDLNDVLEVMLVRKDIVNYVRIFGLKMHQGCFKSVLLLEDGVDKLLLSAKLQQQVPIVCQVLLSQNLHLGPLKHWNYQGLSLCYLQGCFGDKCGTLSRTCLFLQVQLKELERTHWKAWLTTYFPGEGTWTSCGQNDLMADFPAWRQRRCWLWNNTWKALLCCRFPWPEEGVSDAMLLEATFSWEADLTKGSNVNI